MTFNNVQTVVKKLGEVGCFVFCYFRIAERFLHKRIDIIEKVIENISLGNILFDYDNINNPNQFFVVDAAKLLKNLTGRDWRVKKEDRFFKPKDEFYFKVYVGRNKNGSIYYHAEKDDFCPIIPSSKEKGLEVDSLRVCQVL
jgi:hypothetical protein